MKLDLRDFQRDAVREVLVLLDEARERYQRRGHLSAVGLSATTGAGKTVIATAIIEAILNGSEEFGIAADPDAVFLWMTDLPELNRQTADKMLTTGPNWPAGTLVEIDPTFVEPRLSPGRIYFLNTQKLAAGAGLTKRGPSVKRNYNFYDIVRSTIEDEPRRMLYLVVDEAHRGMAQDKRAIEEANSIIQRFIKGYFTDEDTLPAVPVVLGISATPGRFAKLVETATARTVSRWEVPADEVRESGLIKDHTFAWHAGERQKDPMALLPEAVRKWKQTAESWAAYHADHPDEPPVVPALIIQVENESADGKRITRSPLSEIVATLNDIAGPLPKAAFVHAFGSQRTETAGEWSIRYVEPSDIAGDTDARVVFYKSSLGTGWDCPRAEVMLSFRTAEDPTSIAQTVGRMVRTPLHRRIEEDDSLNCAHIYLPNYEAGALDRIVKALNDSGNEAAGKGLTEGEKSLVLRLRADLPVAVAAIEKVPTYEVGTPRREQAIRTLMNLVTFLSSTGLDSDAYERERKDLVDLLITRVLSLESSPAFAAEVREQGEIVVRGVEISSTSTTTTEVGTQTITASDAAITRLFGDAKIALTGDVASAYVDARRSNYSVPARQAQLEAHSLAVRDEVRTPLNKAATARIEALRATYGKRLGSLTAAEKSRWKQILRDAPTPTETTITLSKSAIFPKGADAPAGHLFADEQGAAPIKLNNLERAAIGEDLTRPGVIGWLRCVERQSWALTVPWQDSGITRPFYPDFLVVREEDGVVVVDVLDPHDQKIPDALGKAKGLGDYARDHADEIGHVDLVAEVDGRMRRLHLDSDSVRKAVYALTTLAELTNLYRSLG
jgi:type III restriction enzyme